ncbi:MAG: hypothetical protein GW823_04165 [Bacteroidetes bacterium]|nr:hypothetical protein [Bacteroidota bacterium]
MKNKFVFLQLIFSLTLVNLSIAQDSKSTDSAKLDSILALQKQMNERLDRNPLKTKTFGVEVNLFRLLSFDEAYTFSAGLSFFDIDRRSEIAFPLYVQIAQDDYELTAITLDGHYRYFLSNRQGGFYVSAFSRFAFLNGQKNNYDYYYDDISTKNDRESIVKVGLGIGIGYRIFSYKGIYWGTSLNVGRYFIGKNDHFYSSFLEINDDATMILDIEFLKFGWAF